MQELSLWNLFLWWDALLGLDARGISLLLPQLDMLYFVGSHGLTASEWRRESSGLWGRREVGGKNARRGQRGNCDWYLK